jgi:hypothetical protein
LGNQSLRTSGSTATDHYSKKEWGRYKAYDLAVRAALMFFQTMLQIGLPGRKFKLNTSKRGPILVWSDACWEEKSVVPAGIGFVIYIPPTDTAQAGKWYWSGATVDSEFISQFGVKKQYIGQLELLLCSQQSQCTTQLQLTRNSGTNFKGRR